MGKSTNRYQTCLRLSVRSMYDTSCITYYSACDVMSWRSSRDYTDKGSGGVNHPKSYFGKFRDDEIMKL
jgi:hypothetical protein